IGNRLSELLEGYEIKDVVVFVQAACDIHGSAVVVAVQAFALVACIGDEVARAKGELIFRYADLKTLARLIGHGKHHRLIDHQNDSCGGAMLSSASLESMRTFDALHVSGKTQ